MTTHAKPQLAKPTIAEVLTEFLSEQRGQLAPRTLARYENVVGLLEDCLNGCGYSSLDKAQTRTYEQLRKAGGDERREFCEIVGPEKILPNIWEFLNCFMVRKVFAGKDLMRAAGTVTKKLAAWLRKLSSGMRQSRFELCEQLS